ncbi:MAG: SUMF1/EgtB/PvdO family nonheme iron enzyme [Deltaproteobacteria bacterium]|nr:SUMF1/EgtB/PvdO family nonheme iron enzyme [Deltaproteobacteria bacterium]
MRAGSHRRAPRACLVALALGLAQLACGCGRIGFDPEVGDVDGSAQPDGSADGSAPDGSLDRDAATGVDGGGGDDGGDSDAGGDDGGDSDGGAGDAGLDGCVPSGLESAAGCLDAIDNDCDGLVDVADPDCAGCLDGDGDGAFPVACGGDDCDDDDGAIRPGAGEVCGDGVDQDCSGADLPDDGDSDGSTSIACGGDDCDDGDGSIRPGAGEVCGDGIDQDCSGADLPDDGDADGSVSIDCGGDDCDDSEPSVSPSALEGPAGCSDGIDNDCDGAIDDADPGCGCQHPLVNESCAAGWCRIPPGCFWAGSPDTENCRTDAEDRAPVTLTRAFEISRTEVTQAEYEASMGSNPSRNDTCGPDCPVESVSWNDAAKYCNELSVAAGLSECYVCELVGQNWRCGESPSYPGAAVFDCPGYRLPTEAEWEYSARAGVATATPAGELGDCQTDSVLDAFAWYWDNARGDPQPVCGLQANGWGLCDMLGNVSEWTHDQYVIHRGTAAVTDPVFAPDNRVAARGGSHFDFSAPNRHADRVYFAPLGQSFDSWGFRVVRTVE